MTAPTPDLLDPWVVEGITEPTPAPVARPNPGAAILDQTRAYLARFATFPTQAALDVATVWACHTHVVDTVEALSFDTSPRLIFVSDKPASGKSVAMESVLRLSYRGNQVIDPTPATFAQLVSEERATVGIDELDVLFGQGSAKATLRSLLNAGYRRGAKWSRGNRTQTPVSVFSALTMAGLGKRFRVAPELAPLRGRSIVIEMQPAEPGEVYRERLHGPLAAALNEALTKWAKRNAPQILSAYPEAPEGIHARQAEVSEPLLMVADRAGGHWPTSIREALRELLLGEVESPDETPLQERFLLDLADVFGANVTMSTVAIVDGMRGLPAPAPWATLWPNRNTAPRELAAMLTPLGVPPCPVRIGDTVARGYHSDALAPIFDQVRALAALGAIDLDGDEA